ncbi:UDP-2,3-diacylglucosamine diphosphatase [Endothiovibrio diazotrophicus]
MTNDEALFVADLHLDPGRPAPLALFHRFLAERAAGAEALYILGDLFEVWLGDDDDTPAYHTALAGLRRLAESGTEVALLPGNRDFLAGPGLAEAGGLTLLEEPTLIDLHGTPTLLTHGDLLCTDDHKYQAFRKLCRSPQWTADFLAKPLSERRAMAAGLREKSREETYGKSREEMDVNPQAAAEMVERYGARRMIHGHIHRQGIHPAPWGERYVVADWQERGSLLACTADGCRLERYG